MSDLEPITREEAAWINEGDLTPITRKEQYIKHLYDETQVVPEKPLTREEWFINKAGEELHDVTIEQLNATQNGVYSESGKAYSPVTVAVPLGSKSITANGTYNANDDSLEGYSQVTVNVPYMEKKSASGDIASFSDGAGYPFLKVKANINPVQDLHGYDYPWVGGANLNLLRPGEAKTYTSNGITFTSDGSGKYTIKGTATAGVNCIFDCEEYTTPDGSNTTLMLMNTTVNPNVAFEFYRDTTLVDNWSLSVTNRMQCPFSALSQKTINKYNIFVAAGSAVDMTISPMFIAGDVTANPPSFSPYSNICPISGFTGVNVTVSPTTTEGSGTVYPISWQDEAGIVYGGYIDLVSGVLTKTLGGADLGDLSWVKYDTSDNSKAFVAKVDGIKPIPNAYESGGICSNYREDTSVNNAYYIADKTYKLGGSYFGNERITIKDSTYSNSDATIFKTAMSGVQLVYPLATPQTYNLTPQQINTLIGQNNVWNNTNGQTEVEYFIPIE